MSTTIKRKITKFTDSKIKSLKGDRIRYDVRELGRTGFALRVSPSGTKTFVFIYKTNGQKKRLSLGKYPSMTLNEAHEKYEKAISDLARGKDPALEKISAYRKESEAETVEELIPLYIDKYAKRKKRSWKEDERQLKKDILPLWGNRKAKDITKLDVTHLLDAIIDRGASVGANRLLAVIRKMFNYAIERSILTSNPCSGISKPSKETPRDRALSETELKSFWHGLEKGDMTDKIKTALRFELTTLQRRQEVAFARWEHIQGNIWVIPKENAKNEIRHEVHLSNLALELLNKAKALSNQSPFVFPSPNGAGSKHITPDALSKAIRRNKEKFDIQSFTPHDLRRSAATLITKSKISNRFIVSLILNHSQNNNITAIYDKNEYGDEQKVALDAWGVKLEEIISVK